MWIIPIHPFEMIESQHCDLTFLQNQTPPAQRVCNFVIFSTNMLKNKSKILHILYPLNMCLVQLLFPSDKLQCIVIYVKKKKLFWYQIMPPLLECLNECIKFLIIQGILLLIIIQLITKVCNGILLLAKNNSKAIPLASYFTSNKFWKAGNAKTRFSIIFYFNNLNPLSISYVHSNGCCTLLMVSTIGAHMLLKFMINFL